jgi:hypothetical protein
VGEHLPLSKEMFTNQVDKRPYTMNISQHLFLVTQGLINGLMDGGRSNAGRNGDSAFAQQMGLLHQS